MKTKFVALVASLLVVSALAQAKEKSVKLKDLPPAVKAAVEQQAGKDGKIRGLDVETENGKTVYEAELTVGKQRRDVSFDESGKIVEIEERVALESVPAAAKAAILKAAGKGKVLHVESVSDGSKIVAYEAKVKVDGKKSEVRVDPQGQPAPER